MSGPSSARPYMPGYGIAPAGEGTGLLPWSWAETRLRDSHDYWVATVTPDGRPHLMPVWAHPLDVPGMNRSWQVAHRRRTDPLA